MWRPPCHSTRRRYKALKGRKWVTTWCKHHDVQTPQPLVQLGGCFRAVHGSQTITGKSVVSLTVAIHDGWETEAASLEQCVWHHMQVGQRISSRCLDTDMTPALLKSFLLDRGPAYFFCKRPDRKYFQLRWPCGFFWGYLTLLSSHGDSQRHR